MEDEKQTEGERYAEQNVELIAQLEKIVDNNVAVEKDLIRQRVQPNPYVLVNMRLNLLLDRLLGNGDSNARLAYEIESAKNVQNILMQIQQQKLAQDTKPKLIIPELR